MDGPGWYPRLRATSLIAFERSVSRNLVSTSFPFKECSRAPWNRPGASAIKRLVTSQTLLTDLDAKRVLSKAPYVRYVEASNDSRATPTTVFTESPTLCQIPIMRRLIKAWARERVKPDQSLWIAMQLGSMKTSLTKFFLLAATTNT